MLEGIIRDLAAMAEVKRKPVGLRLIPVDIEGGEEVDFGIFGKTPVLDPLL